MLNLALNQAGNFRLAYYQVHIGNPENRRIRLPMIAPIEIPFTLESRILAVGATYVEAKPSWNTAGYFYQEVDNIALDDSMLFPGLGGSATTSLDAASRRIILNTVELHIFQRLSSEHRYRFEPVAWMPRLTLGIWEYIGAESDSTELLIQSATADLVRIEGKIDNL